MWFYKVLSQGVNKNCVGLSWKIIFFEVCGYNEEKSLTIQPIWSIRSVVCPGRVDIRGSAFYILGNLLLSWGGSQLLFHPPPNNTDHQKWSPWMWPTADQHYTYNMTYDYTCLFTVLTFWTPHQFYLCLISKTIIYFTGVSWTMKWSKNEIWHYSKRFHMLDFS